MGVIGWFMTKSLSESFEALAKLLENPSTSSGRTGCFLILLEISVRGELVEPQLALLRRPRAF
jgi:hypothetical protein